MINADNLKATVGIVIPMFGRSTYVKQCLESLARSNLKDCIVMIIDESMANPQYKQIRGFTVFPNVDSGGFDIGQIKQTQDFDKIVTKNKKCVGVNSSGWMKHALQPNPTWMMNSHFCTQIRDTYLESNPNIRKNYTKKKFVPDTKTPDLLKEFNIQ
jgi:hypothetical protein